MENPTLPTNWLAALSNANHDGIPHTILFAPDGTILARGLRGVDIDKKLEELFNDNK